MLALVSIDRLVPERHPLRQLKPIVDELLRKLSPDFDTMYADAGRPSVPPERLLKSMLLMAFFSVRSERLLAESIGYNMLFRWFLDMDLTEEGFDASTFAKNRDRLLEHDVARKFFDAVVAHARGNGWLSSEHFTVDGTVIQSWASMKSFRPKDDDKSDNNGFGDFKGTKRSNDTHESKTDPEAKLFRKGKGQEAKLAYMEHALMENRNGLVVDVEVTEATGTAECDAAIVMLERERAAHATQKPRRVTLAADKAYDVRSFIKRCRQLRVTPHVAQNVHARRSSGIDARTTRHPGYAVSTVARRLVEKIFGWQKTTGGTRRSRFRGRKRTSFFAVMTAAAFNLIRMTKMQPAT